MSDTSRSAPDLGGEFRHDALTLEAITARSGQRVTGNPMHGQEMFDVFVDGEPATVVPTRMHEPGWYLRARNGSYAGETEYWNIRSAERLRELCDSGSICVDNGGSDV